MLIRGPLRSPLLSSTISRKRLDHRQEPAFVQLHSTIDQLGDLYDGLDAVRQHRTPLKTPEQAALDYKAKLDGAVGRARALVDAQISRIVEYQGQTERAAYEKAGVAGDSPLGGEIRQALRQMNQRARDQAVANAFKNGDTHTIAAVTHCPSPVLTGQINVAVQELTEQFVERVSPGLKQNLADSESAAEVLAMGWDAFLRGAEQLRDRTAEMRGTEGADAAQTAEAALAKAMQG